MRLLVQRFATNPNYAKARDWAKVISITGSAQVVVQGISLVSGILIIRLLSTNEYALYTLANTMLGTMTILADGGISTGVMAEGGKVWQNPAMLGAVLSTGLDLRRKFAIVTLLVAIPALLFLLRYHGASWLMSLLIILAIIPAFFTILSSSILEVAPKLRQDIAPLQKIAVWTNIGRVCALCVSIFALPYAFIAIAAASLPQVWANLQTRKISAHYADWHQSPQPEVKRQILVKVKRMLPLAIYFCLSGQITIWILSIFGSTTSIAQIGALGRLSMLLNLVSMLFSVLIVPRFARLPANRKLLLNWYLVTHAGLIIISLVIVVIVWLFPAQILWILGKSYSGLTNEVLIVIAASCLNMIAGSSFSLYSHRGLVMQPAVGIGIGLIGIVSGILFIDVSTLRGALIYSLFSAAYGFVVNTSYGLVKILRTNDDHV